MISFAFVTYIREHPDQFLELLTQHVQLTILSVLIGVVVAIAPGGAGQSRRAAGQTDDLVCRRSGRRFPAWPSSV